MSNPRTRRTHFLRQAWETLYGQAWYNNPKMHFFLLSGCEVPRNSDKNDGPPLLFCLNTVVGVWLMLPLHPDILQIHTVTYFEIFFPKVGLICMIVPLMPRCIYVKAPSMQVLKDLLLQTPYSLICISLVPPEFIYSLAQYLNPAVLPPFSWIQLVHRGRYRGQLGVVTCNSTV